MADRTVSYPSRQLRGVTPFALTIPDDWVVKEAPMALAVAHPLDDATTSVLLSATWVLPTFDLNSLISSTLARLKSVDPEPRIGVQRLTRIEGRVAMLRIAEFTTPDGNEVAQVQSGWFGPYDGTDRPVELFQMVGTTAVANEVRVQQIVDLISSFRFQTIVAESAADGSASIR